MQLEKSVTSNQCGQGVHEGSAQGSSAWTHTVPYPFTVLPTIPFLCPFICVSNYFSATWLSPLCLAPCYSMTLSFLPRSPVSYREIPGAAPFYLIEITLKVQILLILDFFFYMPLPPFSSCLSVDQNTPPNRPVVLLHL